MAARKSEASKITMPEHKIHSEDLMPSRLRIGGLWPGCCGPQLLAPRLGLNRCLAHIWRTMSTFALGQ